MVWAVKAAGRAIPGCTNCLVQAIAAEAILVVAGHPCELRIGVAKGESGEFLAHAWVEHEGKMLIGEFERGRFSLLRPPGHHM
jgi:hypothetical protein